MGHLWKLRGSPINWGRGGRLGVGFLLCSHSKGNEFNPMA